MRGPVGGGRVDDATNAWVVRDVPHRVSVRERHACRAQNVIHGAPSSAVTARTCARHSPPRTRRRPISRRDSRRGEAHASNSIAPRAHTLVRRIVERVGSRFVWLDLNSKMSTDHGMDVDDAAPQPATGGPRFVELKRSFVNALKACVEPPTAQVRGSLGDVARARALASVGSPGSRDLRCIRRSSASCARMRDGCGLCSHCFGVLSTS